jgi:hypothetical protein
VQVQLSVAVVEPQVQGLQPQVAVNVVVAAQAVAVVSAVERRQHRPSRLLDGPMAASC